MNLEQCAGVRGMAGEEKESAEVHSCLQSEFGNKGFKKTTVHK
jgi:hypothetical protein